MINNFALLFSVGGVFVVVIRAAILDRIEQRAKLLADRTRLMRI